MGKLAVAAEEFPFGSFPFATPGKVGIAKLQLQNGTEQQAVTVHFLPTLLPG